MKRWRVALTVLVLFGLALFPQKGDSQIVGPYAQAQCNALGSFSVTASTALVQAGVAGRTLYICGYQYTSTAAATASLVYGTGTTCGTGTTAITGALNVGTTPTTDHQQYAYFSVPQIQPYLTATQNSICVTTTGAAVTGHIFFGQY